MPLATPWQIRPATERDVPAVLRLIKDLAEYERLAHEVTATEDAVRTSLFGPQPSAEAIIAWVGDEAVGFAVFFHNYSTFVARRGMYLEDLFVLPTWRGRSLGRALLAYLAQLAVERGCARLEWAVLDWNEPAIAFYESLGAVPMRDWTVFRLSGPALAALAAGR